MRRTTGPPSVAPEANDTRFGGNLPMIAALVLAAGSSSRMGEPKPLVRLGDRPLLSRVLDAVRGSRVTQTVVVLGDSADRVRTELRFEGASVVENPEYRRGMSSSLKAGIASLDPATQAFFVVLGDEPFVRSETYDALIAAREATGARIVLPTYHGVRGNPVLLDRSLAAEADAITGDKGCRELHLRHPSETVEVPVEDPGVLIDLDTPTEVEGARQALREGRSLSSLVGKSSRHPLESTGRVPRERPRMRGRENVLGLVGELERLREPFCLAIVTWVQAPTSGKPGFKAIVRSDGSIVGWVGGSCSRHALLTECRAALAEGLPRLLRLRAAGDSGPPPVPGVVDRVMECQSGGAMDIFVEPHGKVPQLIVVGDSPVSESLSALGRLLGFRVVAAGPDIDPARFPDADEVVSDFEGLAAKLDADSYAVVATMATYDAGALAVLLRSPVAYIGLVASRRRAAALKNDLAAEGFSSHEFERVQNPAGLDILARTPEEIALSIAADVVRRTRSRPKSSAAEPAPEAAAHRAVDPVCHMEVDPATTHLTTEHAGTTYYFCSEGCLRRFRADPPSFLA
ncbi:MAG TPA: NTP transferase domain-containing protein [Thermoplasmata archaeon]|nr:NTP transferase domain-containing protein [Thermoplasmata archaeon]